MPASLLGDRAPGTPRAATAPPGRAMKRSLEEPGPARTWDGPSGRAGKPTGSRREGGQGARGRAGCPAGTGGLSQHQEGPVTKPKPVVQPHTEEVISLPPPKPEANCIYQEDGHQIHPSRWWHGQLTAPSACWGAGSPQQSSKSRKTQLWVGAGDRLRVKGAGKTLARTLWASLQCT